MRLEGILLDFICFIIITIILYFNSDNSIINNNYDFNNISGKDIL